jgi:hypothetical protein
VFLRNITASSMYSFREGMRRDLGAGTPQHYVTWDGPFDARSLLLTPNSETVYGLGFLALEADGPTVVEVPAGVLGVFNDMWMREVENLGPAGPDRGAGGSYLVLPPGHDRRRAGRLEGYNLRALALSCGDVGWQDGVVVVRTLAFLILRRVLGMVGCGPAPDAKDLEIAVLRHQLAVLRRQVVRPRYTPGDRMLLATLAKLLPRDRWPIFLVTPSTLLRWHRELIRRRWTYPATGRRRGLDSEVVELVLRLARDNDRWATCASPGNAASSAYRCQRPRCGPSCAATTSARHRAAADRAGRSSCGPKPPGHWPATS